MTLREENPIGTPEIGRPGAPTPSPACLGAGHVSGMVLRVPQVRLSEMPRLITSTVSAGEFPRGGEEPGRQPARVESG
jgi:hypothetical protein